MQDLYHDFAIRYEKGDVDDPDQYFTLLKEKGAQELFYRALQRRDEFERMAEHLDDHFQS